MASTKDAAIERARQYAAAGQFDSAIEAWRQVLDKSLDDANVYETIGDLYLKIKSDKEAIEAYKRAAQLFLQQSAHPKVIAVYKKILKVLPDRADLHEQMGDLYAAQGLNNETIAEYLAGAKLYLKTDKRVKALSLFRKITELDPHNISVRMRVAEICLKDHRMDEAVVEYMRIGDEYQRLQKETAARAIYEQILKLSPNHAEARRRLETPSQPETGIPEVVPPALEMTLPEEVQVGDGAPPEKKEEGGAAPVEIEVLEVEPETASPPLEVIVPAEGQAGNVQTGEMEGTIEFNLEELETTAAPAAETRAATTLAEALDFLDEGDIMQAERVVRSLLLADAERPEYLALLGLVYLQKGDASTAYDILYPITLVQISI